MIIATLFICIILQEIQILSLRKENEKLSALVQKAIIDGIEVKLKDTLYIKKNGKDNTGA